MAVPGIMTLQTSSVIGFTCAGPGLSPFNITRAVKSFMLAAGMCRLGFERGAVTGDGQANLCLLLQPPLSGPLGKSPPGSHRGHPPQKSRSWRPF